MRESRIDVHRGDIWHMDTFVYERARDRHASTHTRNGSRSADTRMRRPDEAPDRRMHALLQHSEH